MPSLPQPISMAVVYVMNIGAFLCWAAPAYIFAYNLKSKGMLNSVVFGACTILLIIPIFSYHTSKITEELLTFYGMFLLTAVSTSFVGGALYDIIQFYKRKTSNKTVKLAQKTRLDRPNSGRPLT